MLKSTVDSAISLGGDTHAHPKALLRKKSAEKKFTSEQALDFDLEIKTGDKESLASDKLEIDSNGLTSVNQEGISGLIDLNFFKIQFQPSTEIAVLAAGPVELYGSPVEIYSRPVEVYATPFVMSPVPAQSVAGGGSSGALLAVLGALGLAGGSKGSKGDAPTTLPPVINSQSSSIVAENTTGAAYQIKATSASGSRISYSIGGADSALFNVDAATGVVSFKSSPDFEAPTDAGSDNTYNITVTASDGTLSATLAVAITVSNIYEAPIISSASSVNFNDHGTGVAYTAKAILDSGKNVNFSIDGVDKSLFTIDAVTGAVRFKSIPIFTAPIDSGSNNVYDIKIVADDGVQTASKDVTITVVDAPFITSGLLLASLSEITDAPDSISTPYKILPGQTAQGKISTAGDHDYYKIYLTANTTYSFALTGAGPTDLADPYLSLRDGTGSIVKFDDNSAPSGNSYLKYTPTASGYFYIDSSSANPSETGDYSIAFTEGSKAYFNALMGANIIENCSWSDRGTGVELTYGFRRSKNLSPTPTFDVQLTQSQKDMVRLDLQLWSDVCGIQFKDANEIDGFTDAATILIGNYQNPSDDRGAYAYPPVTKNTNTNSSQGDLWLNNRDGGVARSDLVLGDYSSSAILHELGHAIGLTHPGKYNAGTGASITFTNDSLFVQDTYQYCQMSYFEGTYSGVFDQFPNAPMMFDILAVQEIYGANFTTRSGNTTYGFNANADSSNAYSFSGNSASSAFCIWDGGGIDTIDVSGFSQSQLVNLCPASFSNTGGLRGNVSIAYNCDIENAIGGTGNDILFGNVLDNTLKGGSGNDQIYGDQGVDTAVFNGPLANYEIKEIVDGYSISSKTGGEGVDQLYNVEYAKFSDQTIPLIERAMYNITSYANIFFNENSTGVLYTAAAHDNNLSADITYTLDGPDKDFFNIDSHSGAISFKQVPDRATPSDSDHNNLYNIVVRAFNGLSYSDAQEVAVGGYESVIDLGAMGKLINPVEVNGGEMFYYWDRSGNGNFGGGDTFTHSDLDAIFNQDINGAVGGGGKTDDIYRFATINGYKLALPSIGIGNDQTLPTIKSSISLPGTPIGSETNTANSTYQDLSALWDAYNGALTTTGTSGVPPGWVETYYWSATKTNLGHAFLGLQNGQAWNYPDTFSTYVAVQVL